MNLVCSFNITVSLPLEPVAPTLGLVPSGGAFSLSETLDYPGPITSGCHDNALLLSVMAGSEPDVYSKLIGQPVACLKVGFPDLFFNTHWARLRDAGHGTHDRHTSLGGRAGRHRGYPPDSEDL